MKFIFVTVTVLLLLNASVAQEKKKEFEIKDQKFISNNVICLITKKEQEDAKEYLITPRDEREDRSLELKLALTILQLRLINNAKFNDINCSLKYFIERFKEKGRFYNNEESSNSTVSEYLKILEKLRTDPKYKADYEKNILNSSDLNYYYSVLGTSANDYNNLEPNLARKFFTANFLNKTGNNRYLSQDDWQLFFSLFYSKNTAPPKELADIVKTYLTRQEGSTNQYFLNVYLANVNDLAFNDLFKNIFDNMNANSMRLIVESNSQDAQQSKKVFTSNYLPEKFKCNYARDVVAKNAPKYSKEDIEDLKKMNVQCLNSALADAGKFVYPEDGCPQILFDKGENHANLLEKMSFDFSQKWADCRRKCHAGDKCFSVQDSNGLFSFLNTKYEKDLGVYKEMQSSRTSSRGMEFSILKYDYKPIGICTEKGICGEKIASCLDTDISKKINDELKNAKYQSCKADTDCYIFAVGGGNDCTEYPININLSRNMGMMNPSQSGTEPRRFPFPGMMINTFLSSRIQKINEQCGKPGSMGGWGCQNSKTKPKCEKNLCVIEK